MARKALAAVDVSADEEAAESPLSSRESMVSAPEFIEQKIAETAYFKAEKRGFAPGFEVEDWLEAEREVKDGFLDAQQTVG
jgi:hypothetical protein